MNRLLLKKQLQEFFIEDIGTGDLSAGLFDEHDITSAAIIAKENGVFCGSEIFIEGYQLIDNDLSVNVYVKDGTKVEEGMLLAEIKGSTKSILLGERVLLNLVQRLSGIATTTAEAVRLSGGRVKICDTRKTTPGLRMLEKYAVKCGGGYNHRFGLYDAIMLKDNHLAGFTSIKEAVLKARETIGHTVKIEVETETEEQVREAVQAGADIIMFDNCTPDEIRDRMKLVPDSISTEASGGITLDTIEAYSYSGVEYISLGFLTHSYNALDISLNLKGVNKHVTARNI